MWAHREKLAIRSQGEKSQKKSTLQAPLKERENTQNKARSANIEIKKY